MPAIQKEKNKFNSKLLLNERSQLVKADSVFFLNFSELIRCSEEMKNRLMIIFHLEKEFNTG